jgi:hypothetical protein
MMKPFRKSIYRGIESRYVVSARAGCVKTSRIRQPLFEHGATRLRECFGPVLVLLVVVASTWTTNCYWQANATPDDKLALFDAAHRGDVPALEQAVARGMPVDAIERATGMTPLMWAARGGHIDAARWLLAHGADVDACSPYGPALVHAATSDGSTPMIRFLLEHGADPNCHAMRGRTALVCAAEFGNAESVKLLIRAGADVNLRDRWGNTAISVANDRGDSELVKRLIAGGRVEHLADDVRREGRSRPR